MINLTGESRFGERAKALRVWHQCTRAPHICCRARLSVCRKIPALFCRQPFSWRLSAYADAFVLFLESLVLLVKYPTTRVSPPLPACRSVTNVSSSRQQLQRLLDKMMETRCLPLRGVSPERIIRREQRRRNAQDLRKSRCAIKSSHRAPCGEFVFRISGETLKAPRR